MTDIAADLKDRFWVVELDLLEKWEAHGLLPDGRKASHEVGHFRHGSLLAGIGMKSPAHIGVRNGLHQFGYLGLQIFVRDNQRADGRPHVATARRDGLIDGSLQPVRVLYVSPLHETMWKR